MSRPPLEAPALVRFDMILRAAKRWRGSLGGEGKKKPVAWSLTVGEEDNSCVSCDDAVQKRCCDKFGVWTLKNEAENRSRTGDINDAKKKVGGGRSSNREASKLGRYLPHEVAVQKRCRAAGLGGQALWLGLQAWYLQHVCGSGQRGASRRPVGVRQCAVVT